MNPLPVDIDPHRRACLRALALAAGVGAGLTWPRAARAASEPLATADATDAPNAADAVGAAGPVPAGLAVDWDWVDVQRQRAVPVRLYWPQRPEGAVASRSVPLVVFSHGIGGSRLGYSYLGRHLASQGWACLHVQHVGSDRALWFGNPFSLVSRLRRAAQESEAIHRVKDIHFALDSLLDSALQHSALGPVAEAIDPGRIVMAGHSYGANTSLLAIGARVARAGQVFDFRDERFRAAILVSTPPFYGEQDLPSILAAVQLPTLHITSNEDVILIPGYRSGPEDRLALYEAMPDRRKGLVVFDRGSHSIFTDRMVSGGYELNQDIKGATKMLATAFLRQQFERDPAALAAWHERWQPIVARTAGLAGAHDAKA
ncbi:hypothetical protein AACH06_20100 [Ideonella sp. DXS29W]|uniref:Acetylhydrolase n=1 Tax=Ideonella lacteola TaxID=2984193 RepID=A0ABU9BVG6_9BURK